MWPSISFSPGAIRLGELHELFTVDACRSAILDCSLTDWPNSLCDVQTAQVEGRNMTVVFSYQAMTVLPLWLWNSHIEGRNIFLDTSYDDWPPIRILLPRIAPDSTERAHLVQQGYHTPPSGTPCLAHPLALEISGRHLVSPFDSMKGLSGHHLLVQKHDRDDVLVVGIEFWRNLIVHKDEVHEVIVVRSLETRPHISSWNLIMFGVLYYAFIRRTIGPHVIGEPTREIWLSLAIQMGTIPVALVGYGLQSTRLIMQDFTGVYIATGVILGVMVAAQLAVLVRLFALEEYLANVVNNTAHISTLLIGMWVLFLERRTDNISTIVTATANILIVYYLAHFVICIVTYYVHLSDQRHRTLLGSSGPLWHVFLLAVVPAVFVWQTYLAYRYFLRPLLVMHFSDLDTRLVDPTLVVIFLFIFSAALYMQFLFVRKAAREAAHQLVAVKG